jgi:general stress protein YciG
MAKGLSGLPLERRREIASAGGKAVPAEKRSFSQNRKLAVTAGAKGGRNNAPENRSFSKDRELAAAAGRKGGSATQKKRRDGV